MEITFSPVVVQMKVPKFLVAFSYFLSYLRK